ncbi:FdhD protein [Mucilaginibacter oryzae]|uniref:Protein FdhD n=1 Tax=Mucilaginibacter oryzae TaxID=468058 RepID=A0A316HD34_9SPHI|nr:formate dehydrogenase accessory sulfurtransferase FdhD [Mucilaginibacter oryzae]PWK78163.1 FdhD protein [Mucilaginibacter oryzae]
MSASTQIIPIVKVNHTQSTRTDAKIAIEEPLEIKLEYGPVDKRVIQKISVMMRTPGHDAELATGFLFTEAVIKNADDVQSARHISAAGTEDNRNAILLSLAPETEPHFQNTGFNFSTVGEDAVSAIRTISPFAGQPDDTVLHGALLYQIPDILRRHQRVLDDAAGLDVSALFTPVGELLLLRQDIDRHNALDKIIGAAMMYNWLPLKQTILLLSGRVGFKLVQKAAMAGISIIVAVGAASSLAIQLAKEFDITLIGLLSASQFNIYAGAHRVSLPVDRVGLNNNLADEG